MAGWSATGLFPFDPERVLRNIPKLSAEPPTSKAPEVSVYPRNPAQESPVTPVTPLTVEGLTSLHDLIKQELDEPGKERIQRHVRKLAGAAKVSFANKSLF